MTLTECSCPVPEADSLYHYVHHCHPRKAANVRLLHCLRRHPTRIIRRHYGLGYLRTKLKMRQWDFLKKLLGQMTQGIRNEEQRESYMRSPLQITPACCPLHVRQHHSKTGGWASLVAQWLRICLLMQGTRVRALVWEDPTCRRATGPVSHNY